MARTKKEINWDLVEKRMEAGNTAKDIARAFHIDINTFYRRFKEEFECNFADYACDAPSSGKANLAFTQYAKALSGNSEMLKLLGREWLGQGKEIINESCLSTIKTELEQGNIKQHDDKPIPR